MLKPRAPVAIHLWDSDTSATITWDRSLPTGTALVLHVNNDDGWFQTADFYYTAS